jgi:hypothetical protein
MDHNCRVSVEELNHDRKNMELESIFSAGLLDIKCWHCGDKFSNKDMFVIADHVDKGLCNDCSEIDDVREYWIGE